MREQRPSEATQPTQAGPRAKLVTVREFAALYTAIDETNRTNEKVAAMVRYFEAAPPEDSAWAVHFLIGRRPKRLVKGPNMWEWAIEAANIPAWLFAECF